MIFIYAAILHPVVPHPVPDDRMYMYVSQMCMYVYQMCMYVYQMYMYIYQMYMYVYQMSFNSLNCLISSYFI